MNCDEHVRLCVCLSANLSAELHVKFSPTFSACYLSRGSVLLWQRCDMFCTSCFFDDVICTRNGQECKRRDTGVYLIIVTQPYLAARRILN